MCIASLNYRRKHREKKLDVAEPGKVEDGKTLFPAEYVLPRKHLMTKLVVDPVHRIFRRGNFKTVVNEVLQSPADIPRLRTRRKQVAVTYQRCNVMKATP